MAVMLVSKNLILRELNSVPMQTLSFVLVKNNVHWSREWKQSIFVLAGPVLVVETIFSTFPFIVKWYMKCFIFICWSPDFFRLLYATAYVHNCDDHSSLHFPSLLIAKIERLNFVIFGSVCFSLLIKNQLQVTACSLMSFNDMFFLNFPHLTPITTLI